MTTTSAYSTSVKLPNLISVPHPSARFAVAATKLGIEGRATSGRRSQSMSRNCQITALLEGENFGDRNNRQQKSGGQIVRVNIDEIMNLISDKLSTGYHGVEHLFKSNDIHKDGRLSKEAFKWVLNQLCGYISNDAWSKLCLKFNLNERDSISFDEFISNFLDNQKVQRELISSSAASNTKSIQLINPTFSYSYSPNQRDYSSSSPKLSAAYCLALLKARASQSDFNPAHYLPQECLNNSKLIMPYHLENLLRKWNLDLTDGEFDKLWQRFDLNNSGGVKAQVFLRLINYKPYQLEELSRNLDLIRTKTCINFNNRRNRNSKSCVLKLRNHDQVTSTSLNLTTTVTNNCEQVKSDRSEEEEEERRRKGAETVTTTSFGRSSLSAESRIKSMVHVLKNSSKFAPGQDLVAFLNNKLNEGYLLMRTAFEYVDQDCFGYLLLDEFKCVLEEFNIRMNDRVFQSLLKKYSLLKKNQLVDYCKFLKIFQDQRDIKSRLQKSKSHRHLSEIEESILEFFHASFYSILDFINDSNGSQSECSIGHLKKLMEQKFSISIDSKQLGALYRFLGGNNSDELLNNDDNKINWVNILEKFSSIDPWKTFKESIELSKSVSSKSVGNKSGTTKTEEEEEKEKNAQNKSGDVATKKVEFKEKEKADEMFSDEDEEVKKVCGDDDDDNGANKDDDHDHTESYAIKKYLLSIPTIKQSTQMRKQLRKELKTIKKVEKKIENVLRTQFHHVNKVYSLMDPSHSEKINKEKFGQLLAKCELELSQDELDLVWRDFDDADLVPFSNIVRRFFKPDEFDRIREVLYKRKINDTIKEDLLSSSRKDYRSSRSLERSLSLDTITMRRRKTPIRHKMSPSLIERLKIFVNQNFNELRSQFENEDKDLVASVSKSRTMDVFKKLNFELDKEDRDALLSEFDQNGCEFDYVKFLNHFKSFKTTSIAEKNENESSISIDTLNPVIKQIIVKLRDSPETSMSARKSTNKQKVDLNNLKNLFKKFDAAKKGYLEPAEFRALLDSLQIEANSNDMYLISSQFDPDLTGLFRYEMFLKSFINSII